MDTSVSSGSNLFSDGGAVESAEIDLMNESITADSESILDSPNPSLTQSQPCDTGAKK